MIKEEIVEAQEIKFIIMTPEDMMAVIMKSLIEETIIKTEILEKEAVNKYIKNIKSRMITNTIIIKDIKLRKNVQLNNLKDQDQKVEGVKTEVILVKIQRGLIRNFKIN